MSYWEKNVCISVFINYFKILNTYVQLNKEFNIKLSYS
jgi:hypothetical protein